MLTVTEEARQKILTVLNAAEQEKLRVSIRGGGCAGFEYDFGVTKEIEDGDHVIDLGETAVVVDPISLPYLEGAILDYVEQNFAAQFVFRNPNAQSTCGCGKSFAG